MAENELCDIFRLSHPGEPDLHGGRKPFEAMKTRLFFNS